MLPFLNGTRLFRPRKHGLRGLYTGLQLGFPAHTWFRRDRESLGGGIACASRSNLLPTPLPSTEHSADSKALLIRLGRVGVILVVSSATDHQTIARR